MTLCVLCVSVVQIHAQSYPDFSNGGGGDWQNGYYRPITITNSSGSTLTDYQVPITPFTDANFLNNSGLVGSWHFSEGSGTTTADTSGNGNNGTLVDGPTWTPSGRFGNALSFDGKDDYVNLGSPASLDNIPVKTIEFWTKLNAQTTTSSTGSHWINKGDTGWFISTNPVNNRNIFAHNFSVTIGRWSFPQFSLYVWHHVVVVYDRRSSANDPLIYVDGIPQPVTEYSTPSGTANDDSSFNLQISKSPGYPRWVDGFMDEVRIYNRAMTQTEINAHYLGRQYVSPEPSVSEPGPETKVLAAPSNLVATAVSSSQIDLTWQDNSENETGFELWFSYGGTKFYWSMPLPANSVNYSHNYPYPFIGLVERLRGGCTYFYKVRAYNGAGYSDFSDIATATTPLETPIRLTAKIISDSQIELSWDDTAHLEAGFKVERKTGETGDYAQISIVPKDMEIDSAFPTISYTDIGLLPCTKYYYRVKAYNQLTESEYSNEATATTFPDIPSVTLPVAPTGLTATALSAEQVLLQWTDNSDNEFGFKIEWKEGIDGVYRTIDTLGPDITTYLDITYYPLIHNEKPYYYRIYSFNNIGNSAYSDEVMVIPPRIRRVRGTPYSIEFGKVSPEFPRMSERGKMDLLPLSERGSSLQKTHQWTDFNIAWTNYKNFYNLYGNKKLDGTDKHEEYRKLLMECRNKINDLQPLISDNLITDAEITIMKDYFNSKLSAVQISFGIKIVAFTDRNHNIFGKDELTYYYHRLLERLPVLEKLSQQSDCINWVKENLVNLLAPDWNMISSMSAENPECTPDGVSRKEFIQFKQRLLKSITNLR